MVLIVNKPTVHVQVPDNSLLSFTKNFSLQIWCNPETFSDEPGYQLEPGWPALLAKTRSWQDGFGIFGEKQGDANVIYVYINEYNKTFVKCSIPLHSWTCLLMTFEWKGDCGTLKMYMNGVFVSAREDMPPMRLNDADLCIGACRWNEKWYGWHGAVGPVSVWDYCLKESELVLAMAEPSRVGGLVLHLSMQETSGDVMKDSGPHGLHANICDGVKVVDRSSLPEHAAYRSFGETADTLGEPNRSLPWHAQAAASACAVEAGGASGCAAEAGEGAVCAEAACELSTSQILVQLMQMMQKMEQGLLARMDKLELRLTAMDEKLERQGHL